MRAAYSGISQLSEHKRRDERDNQRCAKQKEGVTERHHISLLLHDMPGSDHGPMRSDRLIGDTMGREVVGQLLNPGAGRVETDCISTLE